MCIRDSNITHAYLQQHHRGIKVFNGILNLNLRGDQLLSFGNRWITDMASAEVSNIPDITAANAVGRAATHLGHSIDVYKRQVLRNPGAKRLFAFTPGFS